jgi:hypothetical protein
MREARYVYLTLPESTVSILHIAAGNDHIQFRVTRNQLFALNAQIADALINGNITKEHAFDEQLVLSLS